MSKVITLANFKGGVGKTTSTLNIGAGLSILNKKVLLIDLDPQFNLTQSLGVDEENNTTIYEALTSQKNVKPVVITDNLHLIPSSLDLIKAELELSSQFKREFILSKVIESYKANYDYIIIDCPPALGLLTINSFIVVGVGFAPWAVYLIPAFWRLRFWQWRRWRSFPRQSHLGLFAACWFGVTFSFFTIAATKLPSYVLPLMPAAAILVSLYWVDGLCVS